MDHLTFPTPSELLVDLSNPKPTQQSQRKATLAHSIGFEPTDLSVSYFHLSLF